MKLLIIQPKLEKEIEQLEHEIKRNPDVNMVIFPEGYLNENVEQACELAKSTNTILIGGHRRFNERPKDRTLIINQYGKVVLDRIKYSETKFLKVEGLKIGHILCDEIVLQGIKSDDTSDIDLIVHPIGVGMFSDEQFDEWINTAKSIAMEYKTMMIGTSHADGSFGDSGVSIPIAYCIDKNGDEVFISKNDVRTRILDITSEKADYKEEN